MISKLYRKLLQKLLSVVSMWENKLWKKIYIKKRK